MYEESPEIKGLGSSGEWGDGGRGRNERRGGAEKVGGVKLRASLTITSAGAPMSRSVPNFPDKSGSCVAEVRASEFLSCSPASVGASQ